MEPVELIKRNGRPLAGCIPGSRHGRAGSSSGLAPRSAAVRLSGLVTGGGAA